MSFVHIENMPRRIAGIYAEFPWLASYVRESAITFFEGVDRMNPHTARKQRTIWATPNVEMRLPGPGHLMHQRDIWIVDKEGRLVLDVGFPGYPPRREMNILQRLRFVFAKRKSQSLLDALHSLDKGAHISAHYVVVNNGNSLRLFVLHS